MLLGAEGDLMNKLEEDGKLSHDERMNIKAILLQCMREMPSKSPTKSPSKPKSAKSKSLGGS
jgi:hypothetical protein